MRDDPLHRRQHRPHSKRPAGASQLDNTIVLFTSDHGNYMGEHGLYNKNQLYETAHHVAMLARYSAKIAAGTALKDVVSTVDFLPTVCRLAGNDMFDGSAGNRAWIHHSSLERAGVFTPDWKFALVKDAMESSSTATTTAIKPATYSRTPTPRRLWANCVPK